VALTLKMEEGEVPMGVGFGGRIINNLVYECFVQGLQGLYCMERGFQGAFFCEISIYPFGQPRHRIK